MLPVSEARARMLEGLVPTDSETIAVSEGLGRVLAKDLAARRDQPPQAVSAMDGYAVRAGDVTSAPITLAVIGEIAAGAPSGPALGPGEAARIFTGAALPKGADAIVIQENTERDGDRVMVRSTVPEGHYVRPRGLDFSAGWIGLSAGTLLSARDIGLAAAMNHPWLPVRRRPRVAIIATGDEVVMPGEPMRENQIVSSNGLALAAFVQACGGEPVPLGIAPDDPDTLGQFARAALTADLVLTSGGASVGKHDLVRQVFQEQGMALDFWKIAMRPGKPLIFGRIGQTPMLGLPGNPVSSLVCATLFLRPMLAALLGRDPNQILQHHKAQLEEDLPANDEREDYLRAIFQRLEDGNFSIRRHARQDSSMLANLAHSNCLLVRAPYAPAAQAGETVEFLPLEGGCLSI